MHLTEHLSATGVSLCREVGVIVEEISHDGQTQVTCARIARVCVDLPVELIEKEEAHDFDPEYDIAVLW